ncbi:hypothetical protein QE152_g33630 [Popillia japonica]|uniref:Uncharacterized protein n=1 Tax=Popillia japonica TaxID=7064 RepID=A0AAW1IWB9_POPJA
MNKIKSRKQKRKVIKRKAELNTALKPVTNKINNQKLNSASLISKIKSKKQQKRVKQNKSKLTLNKVIKAVKNKVKDQKVRTLNSAILIAKKAADNFKNKLNRIKLGKRVIPVPKKGGILPLIPIFAGLSALGALSGGAAAIAKAVNQASQAKKQLSEAERHNKTMESIAMGKGLYLKPYKKGLGLYLNEIEAHRQY